MNTLNLALLQPNIVWQNPSANQQQCEALLAEIPSNTNLIVLPEMWATGFTMTPNQVAEPIDGSSVAWMQQMAQNHKAAVCGSLAIKVGKNFYNRFVFAHPNSGLEIYDKYHPYTPSGEADVYRRGTPPKSFLFEGWRIRPLICYDLRFPLIARNTDDYDLLLCVANWPEARIQAWNALLRARAIENMAYCVGVNRTGKDAYRLQYPGHSASYNALGDVLIDISQEETLGMLSLDLAALHQQRLKLPFLHDRDSFQLD